MLDLRTQWGRPGQVAPHYDISTSNSTKNQITNPQMVYTKPCFFRANKIIEHLPTCNDSSTMLPSNIFCSSTTLVITNVKSSIIKS